MKNINRIKAPIAQPIMPDSPPPVHDQDQVVVRISCYEPNSHRIELTGEDLCRNTLFIGTVGSGKTTSMNPMLRDLIAYRAGDPERRVGMLIIDSKMDETVEKVRLWASDAGRAEDLQVLSPDSAFYFDFLGGVKSFEDIDEAVEKICSSVPFADSNNEYWVQGRKPLLDAALTIMLVTSENLEFSEVIGFLSGWLMNPGSPDQLVAERLARFSEITSQVLGQVEQGARNKLQAALNAIRMWSALDQRTKSNWTSIFTNCLNPLVGANAQYYFLKRDRQSISLDEIVRSGKIIILSVNAAKDPSLAQLIGRLIKADFYRAAQSRRITFSDAGRLVGLIMDEYPLVVTGAEGRFGDIVQLQSLRSKRAFVVAATQGLVSLDMVIGERAREALLINFNNLFLLNSHEAQVDRFAQAHFGLAPRSVQTSLEVKESDLEAGVTTESRKRQFRANIEDWICPPGRLSRLALNQAFISLSNGPQYTEPVWIEPLFSKSGIAGLKWAAGLGDETMNIIHQIREQVKQGNGSSAASNMRLLTPNETFVPDPMESPEMDSESGRAQSSENAVEQDAISRRSFVFTRMEFVALTSPKGLLGRYLAAHPQEASGLVSPQYFQNENEERTVGIPTDWILPLMKMRASGKIDKEFKKFMRLDMQSWPKTPGPLTLPVSLFREEYFSLMAGGGILDRFLRKYPDEVEQFPWAAFTSHDTLPRVVEFPQAWLARLLKMPATAANDHAFHEKLRLIVRLRKEEQAF